MEWERGMNKEEDIITIDTWFALGHPKEYVHKDDGLYHKEDADGERLEEKTTTDN